MFTGLQCWEDLKLANKASGFEVCILCCREAAVKKKGAYRAALQCRHSFLWPLSCLCRQHSCTSCHWILQLIGTVNPKESQLMHPHLKFGWHAALPAFTVSPLLEPSESHHPGSVCQPTRREDYLVDPAICPHVWENVPFMIGTHLSRRLCAWYPGGKRSHALIESYSTDTVLLEYVP